MSAILTRNANIVKIVKNINILDISVTNKTSLLNAVRRKIGGDTLTEVELAEIIRDVASHHYSPMEIGAFLVDCAAFMTAGETLGAPWPMLQR